MDNSNRTIILYSAQTKVVLDKINRDGHCFSKKKYVALKYEESAPIFITAYDWYVKEAIQYCDKPKGAEYPYWAFKDKDSIEPSNDTIILKLAVPIDEIVFFDMYKWYKILKLQYLGEDEKDEIKFHKLIENYGIKKEIDILLTNFYPDLKKQIYSSWQRLFKDHMTIQQGNYDSIERIQAGLWQIKREWLIK